MSATSKTHFSDKLSSEAYLRAWSINTGMPSIPKIRQSMASSGRMATAPLPQPASNILSPDIPIFLLSFVLLRQDQFPIPPKVLKNMG